MEISNIIPFKRKKNPKKTPKKALMDNFEKCVQDTKKSNLQGFILIRWDEEYSYIYNDSIPPISSTDFVALLEINKQKIINELINDMV